MKKMNLVKNLSVGTVVLFGFSFLFTSCRSDESEIASITPKEALINYASNKECQMVASIRLGDLIKKSGLQDDLLPMEMKMMADGYISQYLDSKETGMDLNSTSYMFGDFSGLPKAPEMVAFVIGLTDGETFGAFLESQTRMSPEEADGYEFISLPNGSGVIAWNKGMAIVAGGNKFKKNGGSALDEVMESISSKGKGNVKELESFTAKKADFGFYMDYDKYMKVAAKMPEAGEMMSNPAITKMMKDAYLSGFVNFDNGKITLEYDLKGNGELSKFMKSAYGKGNPEFANYLGNEDLIGFATMSMNIDHILGYYEEIGFFDSPEVAKGLTEMKDKTGLSLRDIASKFSGDFSVSFIGIEEDAAETEDAGDDNPYAGYYEKRKNTKPVLAFAVGIRDSLLTKAFDTIAAITRKQNMYTFPEMGGMCLKNKILFISTDEDVLNDFALDGRLNTYNKNNAQAAISENPVYGYFNFDALSKAMMAINPEVAVAVASMDYAEMKATKDGRFIGVLHMKNKNENSLKSLAKMIINSASKMSGLSM